MKLKLLLISFLIPLLGVSLHAQEIGLQMYSLRNQLAKDVPATMAKVKEMGFKELELSGTYGLPFPDFMKLLAKYELSVISFGTDFEKLKKFPQAVADEARALGAKYIVCFWIPHKDSVFTKEDVDEAAAVFNSAGKIIAQNGLLLCYHPHGYEFQLYNDAPLFTYMMEKFDSRYVHLEMDVFWIKQTGTDPMVVLKKYSNRVILMHLKDRKRGTPNSLDGYVDEESNVVLGTGDVDIAAIVKEARALGIKHYFIEDESSNAEEQIPQSLAFLKSLH